MLSFLLKKMRKNKWITFCLVMGNILLIGIVSAIPLYADATMQRLLMRQNDAFIQRSGIYPGLLEMSTTLTMKADDPQLERLDTLREYAFEETQRAFELPSLVSRERLIINNFYCIPEAPLSDKQRETAIELSTFSGFDDHAAITLGRAASKEAVDGVVEVVVSGKTYDSMNLLLDTIYLGTKQTVYGEQLKLRVTGVFDVSEPSDFYWSQAPSNLATAFVVPENVFHDYILPGLDRDYQIRGFWQQNLDLDAMHVRNIDTYLSAAERFQRETKNHPMRISLREYFSTTLTGYTTESQKLNTTLWVLQTPMFVMLAFFIFMVSKQILALDRNDISVLKSRGASRGYIIGLYLVQGLMISAVSAVAGYGLGIFICRVTGASAGFLNLVERTSLPVSASPQVFFYMGAASLLSMLTMIIPVIGYSKVSIVSLKQERATRRRSLWQILFLDFICLGVGIYGLWSFYSSRDVMAASGTAQRAVDPLLFLASSLFIIGLGLLCLRVFPWIVKLLYRVSGRLFSPALYASFLRVIRSIGDEQFIMIFLVFTLATGIFSAKVARTINLNAEDSILHSVGADVRIKEVWRDNTAADTGPIMSGADAAAAGSTPMGGTVYYEPDFGRYRDLPEVESATKVLYQEGSVSLREGRVDKAKIMGVVTDEFGKTAWYRSDLLPVHFYNYLNTLSRDPKGVLLSSNFKQHFKIGDVVTYRQDKNSAMGIVYGFVDYWPGYLNFERVKNSDGSYTEKENWLVVANLGYLQSSWGVTPYEIWMRTSTDSNNFLVRFAEENSIRYTVYKDAKAGIIEGRNAPVLQGTNGVLTVDFIITLIVCAAGFLLYWILSIRGRVLQFGIFRAMGMSVRNILSILVSEQLLISGIAIALGAGVGELASRLYVPLIQLAYSASEQVLPIMIIAERYDYVRLFTVVGGMLLVCLVVLGVIASRIKIAQALKLGED